MSSYRLALLAICRAQFTVRGTPEGRAGVLAMADNPALHSDMQRDGYGPVLARFLQKASHVCMDLHQFSCGWDSAVCICVLQSFKMI